MGKWLFKSILTGGTILGTASYALADSGTALMRIDVYKLLWGNFIIAWIEALIIYLIFRKKCSSLKFRRIWLFMIAANYLSMIVGRWMLLDYFAQWITGRLAVDSALYILRGFIISLFAASFIVTLILEWPFCLLAVRKVPGKFKASLTALFASQTATYALMVPVALWLGMYGAVTNVKADPAVVTDTRNDALIYYVDKGENAICSIRINGTDRKKLVELADVKNRRQFVLKREALDKPWSLYAESGDGDSRLLLKDISFPIVPVSRITPNDSLEIHVPSWFDGFDYRPAEHSPWIIDYAYYWLVLKNESTGERFNVSLDTPFIRWFIEGASMLPGDRVVFSFGRRIVLLDIETRRIGQITTGWLLFIAPDQSEEKPGPTQVE